MRKPTEPEHNFVFPSLFSRGGLVASLTNASDGTVLFRVARVMPTELPSHSGHKRVPSFYNLMRFSFILVF